ncbi:hypothetical protein L6164_000628 [Bauhinia variegata]|uniref:Uncharacterized protein n=1 Tax=Bauhinia variegata TaxID=167791 RepID=A0ACB9Q8I6_BAUVA|nr:hypothetical protein L6164_000628 [Bauhinia variegata]
MARFFVLSLLLSLMAAFNTLPPVAFGEIIPILSIDGGGIKGIIPAVILEYLESALQERANNKSARIADYFDVIAGTSTGGIIASMLTAPDSNNTDLPRFTASEIIQWYKEESPCIFNQSEQGSILLGPKYNGNCLHDIAREQLQEIRLGDALTDLVIPTFDLKQLKPVIFSSFKINQVPDLNAKLADIVISTSAAPTLLPPYNFTNGNTTFNMIDGAVVADNPAFVACNELMQQGKNNTELLLLSLGTGNIPEGGWNATEAANWGIIQWGSHLLTILGHSSTHQSGYYLATLFNDLQDNYLRIQEYNLSKEFESSDNSTQAYLDGLEDVGRKLLNETAKRINVITSLPEDIDNITNAQALDRWADILYELKQQRLAKRSSSSMDMKNSREMMKEMAAWAFQ